MPIADRVAAEHAAPVRVADHRGRFGAGRRRAGTKDPPPRRFDAERVEVVVADQLHDHALPPAVQEDFVLDRGDGRSGERAESRHALAQLQVVVVDEIVDRPRPLPGRLEQLHELGRPGHRQRFDQQRVEQAEERDVAADAEGQRENSRQRESGAAADHRGGVGQVLAQVLEPAPAPRRARILGDERRVAEIAAGGGTRVLVGEPAGAALGHLFFEVELQLVANLRVTPRPADDRS